MKRSSSPSPKSTTRLQIVPWFSKKEWQEIYEQAYSADVEFQEKAYTEMCIWKARYPNLPLGVECTMSMLHVKLCDKERGSSTNIASTYADRDLQFLYSTAVMRFLNQLSVMSDHKDSMYKVAAEHQLPDWIINLRHEAAHGNSMPALYMLRQASDIILQWLKENYWESEAGVMTDVCRQPEQTKANLCAKITKLLDLWVTLKIHHWSHLGFINRIDDKDIREQAMDLATEEGRGIKLPKELSSTESTNKMKIYGNNSGDEVKEVEDVEGNSEEYTHKIKTAFEPLLRALFEPLKSKSYKKIVYQNCLIDCLIHNKSFCPPIDVEQLSESEVFELMSLLGDLWRELLESLQSLDLLHCLLKQLMLQSDQLVSAQLWLRLVTQLIAGHPPPQPPATATLAHTLADCLSFAVKPEVLMNRINLQHTKMHRCVELKPASADELEVLQQLGRQVVTNPTRFTTQYLHSLLSLWEPRLSWEVREKLCALARIYNGQQPLRNPPSQVHTAASLSHLTTQPPPAPAPAPVDHSPSPWKLYTGEADWSHCALGSLPW